MSKKKGPSQKNEPASEPGTNPAGWRAYRREITFLGLFLLLLVGSFTLLSVGWVDRNVVVPFTGAVAEVSGRLLAAMGQDVTMRGTQILSPRFSVNIENGCNGLEAMLIFLAAVLSFPASWKARGAGLVLGLVAIQAVNLVRVVALFLTGAYFPSFFDTSHTVIWQTLVILASILLWLYWASRFAGRPAPGAVEEPAPR